MELLLKDPQGPSSVPDQGMDRRGDPAFTPTPHVVFLSVNGPTWCDLPHFGAAVAVFSVTQTWLI